MNTAVARSGRYTRADLAALVGGTEQSISDRLHKARTAVRAGEAWPVHVIPEPLSARPLTWAHADDDPVMRGWLGSRCPSCGRPTRGD